MSILIVLLVIASLWTLTYRQASIKVWTVSVLIGMLLLSRFSDLSMVSLCILWLVFLSILTVLNISTLRRKLISNPAMGLFKSYMPKMSKTEREALEAGTVSWERELFIGRPDWQKLHHQSAIQLTAKEQAFLDGPVDELCSMINDWDITHNRMDMPPELWNFIKANQFFGMIIPEQYGGLDFSSTAQMAIFSKIWGKSVTVATTISVPNSLGPGELIIKYGTNEQKNHYLPRLAKGQDIPCFALTSASAGSDAASMPDIGIICKGTFNNKEIIGIKLNFDKRYITFGPIATVIGLAFKCYDPDNLIGEQKEIGITCALIPHITPGIIRGRRHLPLNTAFINGPVKGENVFIPIDWVIGGKKMLGQGWRQLMECLAAGRAVSLPSSACGGSQATAYMTSAYARIRQQFNLPIGKFEGIQEPLARIFANTYIIQSATQFITEAIDQGAEPAVASAIVKYHCTERARKVSIDAMDIHGGKAICLGPNNYLAHNYQTAPIAITVEGANILTRNLIIFGQGAFRCHPHLFPAFDAVTQGNQAAFDTHFFAHANHLISVASKSLWLALTNARLSNKPDSALSRYYQMINRLSASFAFAAEVSIITIGSDLKRKENLSARLGDVLSLLYLCSACLKRFKDDGEPEADIALVSYVCQSLLRDAEYTLFDLIRNFPIKRLRKLFKLFIIPFGRRFSIPSDELTHRIAEQLLEPCATRDRLSKDVYKTVGTYGFAGQLNAALIKSIAAEPYEKIIRVYAKQQGFDPLLVDIAEKALAAGVVNIEQLAIIQAAQLARKTIIAVDDFPEDSLARKE